jgi:hypothetical protein
LPKIKIKIRKRDLLHHHMQVDPRVLMQNSSGSISIILLSKNFSLLVVFEKIQAQG